MVNFHHVVELHKQHFSTAVAVDGDGNTLLAVGEVDELLLDVSRTVGTDGVLDAAVQQIANVVSAFNDDQR